MARPRRRVFADVGSCRLRRQDTDCELLAVGRGGGKPDLVFPEHRRGPAAARDGGFPGDVLGFAPRQGQVRLNVACAFGAAKLIPVGRLGCKGGNDNGDAKAHSRSFSGRQGWCNP